MRASLDAPINLIPSQIDPGNRDKARRGTSPPCRTWQETIAEQTPFLVGSAAPHIPPPSNHSPKNVCPETCERVSLDIQGVRSWSREWSRGWLHSYIVKLFKPSTQFTQHFPLMWRSFDSFTSCVNALFTFFELSSGNGHLPLPGRGFKGVSLEAALKAYRADGGRTRLLSSSAFSRQANILALLQSAETPCKQPHGQSKRRFLCHRISWGRGLVLLAEDTWGASQV